ncbi:hypothetical protein [Rhodopila sp.]|uniref:hypothetical protein n=1 Tax=Rhodopila sp. TaxID=2480087 RepID=UPI003D13ED36
MSTTHTVAFRADASGGDGRWWRRGLKRSRDGWIDVLVGLLCILPLLLTAHLPLSDLPNHLARQYILRDWASSPSLQQFYYIHWDLVPNLALELFVLAARQVMSIDLAVRAFCLSTVLMLFLGTRLINRTLSGGQSRAYRVAPLLCYGGPFQYGFLSYCFGIGLALVLFGVWLRLRARPLAARVRFLVVSGFGLMLCHFAAYGLFAIAVGLCELTDGVAADGWRRPLAALRRGLLPVACLVPVFIVFLLLSPTTGAVAGNVVQFSTLHEKLRSFLAITFFTSPKLESGLLMLAVAAFTAGLLTRTFRFHATGLAIGVVMTVAWLAMPNIAMDTAFIDYRFPWAISFFVVAGLLPGPAHARWVRPFAAGFTVLTVARIALIAGQWLSWEPTLAAIDQALARLPIGSRIMVIEGRLPSGLRYRWPDLANVASYAVARRQAFEPAMFASIAGQILYFKPRYLELWQQGGYGIVMPDTLDSLAPEYDYVLDLLPELTHIAPGLPLVCQESGHDFAILKVVPSGAGTFERDGICVRPTRVRPRAQGDEKPPGPAGGASARSRSAVGGSTTLDTSFSRPASVIVRG